jgi:DNA-binding response OmpR family regulator
VPTLAACRVVAVTVLGTPPLEQSVHPVIRRPSTLPRVGVIDSDSGFVRMLGRRMESLGWSCRLIDGAPSVTELLNMRLNAVVVDPELLGDERWRFLERLGGEAPELAVVVCATRCSVAERVRGLHLAADDWVAKPCHAEEVVARIEAILRRSHRATSRLLSGTATAGDLEIDNGRFQAFANGRSLELTSREFEVLRLLAAAAGRVLTREEIYQQVWGYKMARGDRSVDVFVRKLRAKLERYSPDWTYVHTHVGVGYRFDPKPAIDPPPG